MSELKYSAELSGVQASARFRPGASGAVTSVIRSLPAGTVRSTIATCSDAAVTGEETVSASHRPSGEIAASPNIASARTIARSEPSVSWRMTGSKATPLRRLTK